MINHCPYNNKCEYIETCPARENPNLFRDYDNCEHFAGMMRKDIQILDEFESDSDLIKQLLADERFI